MSNIETIIDFFTHKNFIYEVCMHMLDTLEKHFRTEIKPIYNINIAYFLDIIIVTIWALLLFPRRSIVEWENSGRATNTIKFDYVVLFSATYTYNIIVDINYYFL